MRPTVSSEKSVRNYHYTLRNIRDERISHCSVDLELILYTVYIRGVSGGIVNILGGGSMDYSE